MSNDNSQITDDVVSTGVAFLRSITECYGPDRGVELWDQLAAVLGPSIKGQVLFALLTNQYPTNQIRLRQIPGINSDRIEGIRAIRMVSHLGLKEAKDVSDALQLGKIVSVPIVNYARNEAASLLRSVCIEVL